MRNLMLILAVSLGFIMLGLWISKPAQPACFGRQECFIGADCMVDDHCGPGCYCEGGRCASPDG